MEKFKEKIKKKNLFVSEEFTYKQYVDQLKLLETIICQEVFKDTYNEKFRIADAISSAKCYSISNKIDNSETYYKGISAMKQLEKELAITLSGMKAETHVDHLLTKFVTRDDFKKYKGIYLNNGLENTEIDNLVLTKDGFLLLEIKNIKTDATISKDGRLFVDKACSYEQIPLGEKMERKRNLFKSEIKNILKKKGVHMDIELQSLIVFNEPRYKKCYIHNQSDECWCTSGQLANIVNNLENTFPYSDEQLKILEECCEEFETHQKTFLINYDIKSMLDDISDLMDLINLSREEKTRVVSVKKDKKVNIKDKISFNSSFGIPKLNIGLSFLIVFMLIQSTVSSRITKY